VDSEQLSQDLIRNIDGWLGKINGKIQSGQPIGSEDFDSIFNDSFFSGSEDPIRDIELAQKKINSKLGAGQNRFDESYGKWVSEKMSPADLNPEVVSDKDHITVKLKAPKAEKDSMKINIDAKRIKMNYRLEEKRLVTNPDGSNSSSFFMKRRQRIISVPEGANPDKYQVRASKGSVRIIFDRLKKGKSMEASK